MFVQRQGALEGTLEAFEGVDANRSDAGRGRSPDDVALFPNSWTANDVGTTYFLSWRRPILLVPFVWKLNEIGLSDAVFADRDTVFGSPGPQCGPRLV